ncbi:MAG TPA: CbiQ family ECF transporter T component [Dermatophilaceae bacterium]|nr:CbiQ family ECF transporter T component [Dermatophilaceae bacterium]
MTGGYWLPRSLHPGAWWVWALGAAAAATFTTNPLLLTLILTVAGYVVVSRRTEAPWALSFRLYLMLGAFIVGMRVAYRLVFGGGEGQTVLLRLPEVPLPAWAAGIRLFGTVSAESLLGGLYDGLRLATMVACVGAANALANPKRLLKAVPGALAEVCTAVVVSVTVFPQLVESLQRVRRARRLRGGPTGGRGALRSVAVPVLADALDRSLLLAASMDSRGYGRHGQTPRRSVLLTSGLLLGGLVGICAGVYGTLDGQAPAELGAPMLLLGGAVAVAGLVLAGRRVRRSRYRPDRWGLAETVVGLCGAAAAAAMAAAVRLEPAALQPPLSPLGWPTLPWPAVAGILAASLPAWLTPAPLPRPGPGVHR